MSKLQQLDKFIIYGYLRMHSNINSIINLKIKFRKIACLIYFFLYFPQRRNVLNLEYMYSKRILKYDRKYKLKKKVRLFQSSDHVNFRFQCGAITMVNILINIPKLLYSMRLCSGKFVENKFCGVSVSKTRVAQKPNMTYFDIEFYFRVNGAIYGSITILESQFAVVGVISFRLKPRQVYKKMSLYLEWGIVRALQSI